MNEELPDEKNLLFLFSTTDTLLLVQIVNRKIDVYQTAQDELQKRGLDEHGNWVGFRN